MTSSFESGIFDPVKDGEGKAPNGRGGTRPNASAMSRDAQARRDKVLNSYFDQDGTVSRERLRNAMRADPRLAVDFERTEAVLSEMNLGERPVAAPDVSQSVLARVDELRPYVSAPIRRQVSSARIAVVGALLCGITLVVVLNQVRLAPMARPVVDNEPRTIAMPNVSPDLSVRPMSVPMTTLTTSSLVRSATSADASKYDQGLNWIPASDTPTAALGLDVRLQFHGGHDSKDSVFSLALSPHGKSVTREEPLKLANVLGIPMFLPVRSMADDAQPSKADARIESAGTLNPR